MKVWLNNEINGVTYAAEENVKFNINKMQKYKDRFNEYKRHQVILNNNFEDNSWRIKTHVKSYGLDFTFDEVSFKRSFGERKLFSEFIDSVKSFFLYKLTQADSGRIYSSFTVFKRVCYISHFFDINYIKEFEYILKSNKIDSSYIVYLKEFWFDYVDYELNEKYISMLNRFVGRGVKSNQRELPSFESMFKLGEIIDDFYENRDTLFKDLKEKYFPIIIWWKLTSIIPLRPIELIVTPYDCVERIENDNEVEYKINLNRSISKGGGKRADITRHSFKKSFKLKTIETTEEIYNLIKEYTQMVDYYDDIEGFIYPNTPSQKREYLLSYRSYFASMSEDSKAAMRGKKEVEDFFDKEVFYKLYKKFFKEVVSGIYGKTIVKKHEKAESNNKIHYIQPMDTRHFAIMNMIWSGIEPTIVKELAGHDDIDTTYGYCRYGQTYARNFILSVVKKQSKNNIVDYVASEGQITSSSKRYQLAKLKDKEYASQFRQIEGGYCIYKGNDITPCILWAGNHKRCSYYVSNDSLGFMDILQEQKEMNKEMNVEIETLIWIFDNYGKIEHWAERYKASLSKIKSYMNKEIAFRLENQIFEDF